MASVYIEGDSQFPLIKSEPLSCQKLINLILNFTFWKIRFESEME